MGHDDLTTSLVSLATSKSNFDVFSNTTKSNKRSNIEQGWYIYSHQLKNWKYKTIQEITHDKSMKKQIIHYYKYKLYPVREDILNTIYNYFLAQKDRNDDFYYDLLS